MKQLYGVIGLAQDSENAGKQSEKLGKLLAIPMQTKRRILESDLIYPHGKLAAKTLKGIDGYLLALQYKNPASLGKALSELGGEIYWLPPENDRAVIWLSLDAAKKLPQKFSDRLTYLAQFDVVETKRPCDRCKKQDVLYAAGKYGYPVPRGSPKSGHTWSPQNRPMRSSRQGR